MQGDPSIAEEPGHLALQPAMGLPIPPAPPAPPRWAAPVFCVMGAALVPWTLWLAATLPTRHTSHHYAAAWSGFDIALAGSLIGTGLGMFRRATWTQSVAAAAATLLVCDAWFDVLLAAPGDEQLTSVASAALVELPLAAACAVVARRSEQMSDRARSYVSLARKLHFRRARGPRAPHSS